MNVYVLVLLAAGTLPLDLVSTDAADAIELNHFSDGDGRPVFDQVIFWQWHAEESAYRVRAWRLWKSPAQTPWRDWHNSMGGLRSGGYVTAWFDGDRLRVIRATSFRETWTQHDPELDDRQFLPAHERRGLTGERKLPPTDSRPTTGH
jgi:hypothetical protein